MQVKALYSCLESFLEEQIKRGRGVERSPSSQASIIQAMKYFLVDDPNGVDMLPTRSGFSSNIAW